MFEAEDNIRVPENLDDYVKKGIALGVKKRKANRIKLTLNAAVICLLTLFTVSVRVSPAFAAYMVKVPGLEYLVRFINYDKGLQSAVENNFIQNINSSVTKEGIKVTIKDVIIDNSKAVIFYSIENQRDNKYIELANVNVTNEKGESINGGLNWGTTNPGENSSNKKIENKFDIDFFDGTVLPNKLCIDVKLREKDSYGAVTDRNSMLASNWNFEIPIDRNKIKEMEKTYVLNQEVEVEGQKIAFKEVKITPTRIALKVEYDDKNTKKIFGFDDIAIINEKGETWGTMMNGVSGSIIDENHVILYFQSNYFTNPKSLYIRAGSIRALDKDKLTVVVDLNNNKLIKAPNDRLSLKTIDKNEEKTSIIFNLRVDDILDEKFGYFIFSDSFKDADGKTYNYNNGGSSSDQSNIQQMIFKINSNLKVNGLIFLEINNYPERIKGEFKVKII